jgi:uncharacterized small protein (TIGR04563 family)
MASTEKQKQSLYFPEEMLREIMAESNRLDRSLSWTVQQAWRLAREELRRFRPAERVAPERQASRGSAEDAAAARRPRPSAQVLEFLKGKFDRDLS